MRRHLLLALALLPAAAACRRAPAPPKTVIRLLSGPDMGGGTREIISEFEEMNPDIHVEAVEGPRGTLERQALYEKSFAGRDGGSSDDYDVVFMDVIWLPRFASLGWLRPLDDLFPRRQQALFLPADMAASRYKGRVYRVPAQSDAGLLFYRKDLLSREHIQPPRTFDELVAAARKLQRPPELWGFVFPGKGEGLVCSFLESLWGRGGTLLGEDGAVRLDERPGLESLEWTAGLLGKDGVSPPEVLGFDEQDALRFFQEGKAVFMRNWLYAYGLLQEDRSAVKGQVGFVPLVRASGRRSSPALGGWGYGISSRTAHPEAAWKFIEFATSPESQKIAYMKGGLIPSRKDLFNDPDIIKGSPHYPELLEILGQTRHRPRYPAYPRISEILQSHLTAALEGKEAPAKSLSRSSEEIRAAIRR